MFSAFNIYLGSFCIYGFGIMSLEYPLQIYLTTAAISGDHHRQMFSVQSADNKRESRINLPSNSRRYLVQQQRQLWGCAEMTAISHGDRLVIDSIVIAAKTMPIFGEKLPETVFIFSGNLLLHRCCFSLSRYASHAGNIDEN